MASTAKVGMVGQKPKVLINPATGFSTLTPEQKAQERFERRRVASEQAQIVEVKR